MKAVLTEAARSQRGRAWGKFHEKAGDRDAAHSDAPLPRVPRHASINSRSAVRHCLSPFPFKRGAPGTHMHGIHPQIVLQFNQVAGIFASGMGQGLDSLHIPLHNGTETSTWQTREYPNGVILLGVGDAATRGSVCWARASASHASATTHHLHGQNQRVPSRRFSEGADEVGEVQQITGEEIGIPCTHSKPHPQAKKNAVTKRHQAGAHNMAATVQDGSDQDALAPYKPRLGPGHREVGGGLS